MLKSFTEKVVYPIILVILTPVATLVSSKLKYDDWLAGLSSKPFIALFLFIFIWLIVVLIKKRKRTLRDTDPLPILKDETPLWGYTFVGKFKHKNVLWRVRVPSPDPGSIFNPSKFAPWADIVTPPYCPKCETELEETETFFSNYHWKCINCHFATKNSKSYYNEAVRAKKLAKFHLENDSLQRL